MLIRFRCENFRSIKGSQELSMVASSLKDGRDSLIRSDDLNMELLPAAAIYGPNASGKTNILRGLEFMCQAVRNSQATWSPSDPIPRQPFLLLDESQRELPSTFEVDIVIGGTRYNYGFSATAKEITKEWVYAFPKNRRQTLVERNGKEFTFGKSLTGENKAIENLTRSNSLFLSCAAQNNHERLSLLYEWFASVIFVFPTDRRSDLEFTTRLCEYPNLKALISKSLAAADLGLVAVELKRNPVTPTLEHYLKQALGDL